MERLYADGSLRLQPATYFSRSEHNEAVRDHELRIDLSLPLSRADVVHIVRNPSDVPTNAPEQRVDITFTWPTDYWLYCLTTSLDPRLFVDFKANSCVVIRDQKRFTALLRAASAKALPGLKMQDGLADYVDPLLPRTAHIFVPFAKHFGFTYQREHRFCWMPNTPAQELAALDIEVGPLKEIADLIVL